MDDMTTSAQQDFSAWEQSNSVWVTWQRGNLIFIQNLRQISKMSVEEPFHPVNRFLSSYELFPPPQKKTFQYSLYIWTDSLKYLSPTSSPTDATSNLLISVLIWKKTTQF